MPARLIEAGAGPGQKREIPITGEEFLIGRGTDCDLRLQDAAISRHHCLIRLRGNEATIADLGSINGTFVNGQRIRSQAAISRHHCLIRLRGNEATIADLGSINGTFVNGQRIRSQAVLRSGDELTLDVYRFVIDLENREGIVWGGAAADPDTSTCRLRDVPTLKGPEGKEPG
jgi:pSer/pThr/pTyr-binding forkhead associated (FHA) protein